MRAAVLTAKQSIKTVDQTTRPLSDTEVKVRIHAGEFVGPIYITFIIIEWEIFLFENPLSLDMRQRA